MIRNSAVNRVTKPGLEVPGFETWQAKKFCDSLCGNTDPFSVGAPRAGERDSSVVIATNCWLDSPGIETLWGGEIFPTRPDRQRIFFNLLYEGWNFNSGNYLFTTDTK